jgi:predicted nucleic acid-binding protein
MYLWDSNTAIYYLQQQFSPDAEVFMDRLLAEGPPCISAITEIELLCWKGADESDLAAIQQFISDAVVIELEQLIKIGTAEIRKTHKIKLPDAIIAATALVYELPLVTRNVKDFTGIEGIGILNPWEQR